MNLFLEFLFPKKCVGCGKESTYFCKNCIADILQTDLICPQCDNLSIGGLTHPGCEKSFSLDGLWSLGIYQGSLKRAIQKLKYEPSLVKDFAPVLADITVEYWEKHQPYLFDLIRKDQGKDWVIIPVPLHWFRENKRGFNQAKLIGQIISKKLGLAYCDGLKRIRYTKSQVKLKKHARRQNIRDAFAISSNCNLSPETCILLIDDVWTTGSTLRECCYVLKKHGAQKVWALTLAR
ncbi:ComF family protein [Candidatus Daviesbacteria bacterium]|nr:ComF family protein [Candidatus Daviesbacteria bacterium]